MENTLIWGTHAGRSFEVQNGKTIVLNQEHCSWLRLGRDRGEQPHPEEAAAEPAPARTIDPAKLVDRFFKRCNWSLANWKPDLMVAKVCEKLFTVDTDMQRTVLALQRPYPTCAPGVTGTLLHLLCDFPPDLPEPVKGHFIQSK